MLKVSKEFKTGLVVILAIAILVMGVNFLKGSSLYGTSDYYYAVFDKSGYIDLSTPVTLNGVPIGQINEIKIHPQDLRKVLIKFSINKDKFQIPKGSFARIEGTSILTKGFTLDLNYDADKGFYKVGDTLTGTVAPELTDAVSAEIAPVKEKLEKLMSSVENMVVSVNAFWDTSAAQSIDVSLNEVQVAIARFSNLARNLDEMIVTEKDRVGRVLGNVESITGNIKKSNEKVTHIIDNFSSLSDTLIALNLKTVLTQATNTLKSLDTALADAAHGKGTLGKLLHSDSLHNELIYTTKTLQDLVMDIELHPEKYIHFSIFGRSSKGVNLTKKEEEELRNMLKNNPSPKP
jgi:phospholipid/cholesterol/gamma-HCH transport system substrate-binding protein